MIIPLFEKHPIRGGKLEAFERWKHAVKVIQEGRHLTGVLELLELCYFMNSATSNRTEESYLELQALLIEKHGQLPDCNGIEAKIIKAYEDKLSNLNKNHPIKLQYITGLIDGDGSFNFATDPLRVVSNFTVVQESVGLLVLEELKALFGCGNILKSASCRYQVESRNDTNIVISKLEGAQFNIKKDAFNLYVKGNRYIDKYGFKTKEHMLYLVDLLMSTKSRRRMTKEEYVKLVLST